MTWANKQKPTNSGGFLFGYLSAYFHISQARFSYGQPCWL
jgi:hypothetical protein